MNSSTPQRAIAIATIGFDGLGDENFCPTFEEAPQLGVSKIEFNCWYGRNLTPTGIESIRERARSSGLEPVSLHLPGFSSANWADHAREVSRWMWAFHAADNLGINLVKATGSKRGTSGGVDGIISVLRDITPLASEMGITIALENHANNVLAYPEDYHEIFAEIDAPNVGMCLDTGHFMAAAVDPAEVAADFSDRIVHVDLKDCASSEGRADFVPFGDGIVDFDAVLATLVDHDYSGLFVVEFPRRSPGTAIHDLTAGVEIARPYTTADT